MEDELILADLGIAERRLERIEKDLKRGKSTELDKERELVQRCKTALEEGKPLRSLGLTGDDQNGSAASSSCPPSRCCWSLISTSKTLAMSAPTRRRPPRRRG